MTEKPDLKELKKQKLAKALRENLMRRKAWQRAVKEEKEKKEQPAQKS